MLRRSRYIIFQCSSIFPLELLPDQLTIREDEVEIVNKQLAAEQIYTVLIEDILEVEMESGPFSATIHITRNVMRTPPEIYTISHLHIPEAKQALKIIRNLMDIKRHKTSPESYSIDYLKEALARNEILTPAADSSN